MMNTKSKRDDITRESIDSEKKINDYFKKLYANKYDNLDKLDKFLEWYNLWKIIQKKYKVLVHLLKKLNLLLKTSQRKLGPDGFINETYRTFKKWRILRNEEY